MSTFDTNVQLKSITDHAAGQKIKSIIGKYITHNISQELCDNIMNDLKEAFGENHPAQVNLDDETHDIEVIVRDSNGRFIKCSSRTLFPEEYL
jgi:hypothetical protein